MTSLKVKACDKSHDSSEVAVVSVKYCGLHSGPVKLNKYQDCMSHKILTSIVKFSGMLKRCAFIVLSGVMLKDTQHMNEEITWAL